jgi:hypothetical protein
VPYQPEFTVFVNSTDSFEDTWEPFFHLLHEYWPEVQRVVLNTETKSYSHPGIEIVSTRVARPGEGRIPWGECILRALDHIPTELFVYLQDDYFLYDSVLANRVRDAAAVMLAENLDCLRLMECGDTGPFEPTPYDWLWSLSRQARYRISLQAEIWSKTGIRKYLRSHESPWQMEVWGTKRAARIPGRIWCVSRDIYGDEDRQIIPYVPTGIVKGRWYEPAVGTLFAAHGLQVDFERRGWWDDSMLKKSDLPTRLRKLPRYAFDRIRSL